MEMALGLNAKLYQGASGSSAATEIAIIGNAKLNLATTEATLKLRATAFELTEPAMFQASIDFDILWDETNASFSAIWTAFTTRASRAFLCLPKAGGKGLDADFKVTKFERTEDVEGIVMAAVTIKPCVSTRYPAFV
jgi:hypothetical protein